MGAEFLEKEYELCFAQLRFYDERQESILKYIFTLTSAVGTAEFSIFQFVKGPTIGFFKCEAALSGLVFIATLLLYLAMLQNRLYFVFTARQLNALRGYLLRTAGSGFKNNQLYTSTNFAALKPFSVHTFILIGAALISALFGGGAIHAVAVICNLVPRLRLGFGGFLFILFIEAYGGARYLLNAGAKSADEAVHRVSQRE